jgi:hypothetical protein
VHKPIITDTGKNALSIIAGKVICDSIKSAEIVYKDENGQVIVTVPIGKVSSGDQIKAKVPEPDDLWITLG